MSKMTKVFREAKTYPGKFAYWVADNNGPIIGVVEAASAQDAAEKQHLYAAESEEGLSETSPGSGVWEGGDDAVFDLGKPSAVAELNENLLQWILEAGDPVQLR